MRKFSKIFLSLMEDTMGTSFFIRSTSFFSAAESEWAKKSEARNAEDFSSIFILELLFKHFV